MFVTYHQHSCKQDYFFDGNRFSCVNRLGRTCVSPNFKGWEYHTIPYAPCPNSLVIRNLLSTQNSCCITLNRVWRWCVIFASNRLIRLTNFVSKTLTLNRGLKTIKQWGNIQRDASRKRNSPAIRVAVLLCEPTSMSSFSCGWMRMKFPLMLQRKRNDASGRIGEDTVGRTRGTYLSVVRTLSSGIGPFAG